MPTCRELELEATIWAGDDFELTLEMLRADGTPIPIAGGTVDLGLWVWNGSKTVGGVALELSGAPEITVIGDGTAGLALATFSQAQTAALDSGTYWCLAELTTSTGKHSTLSPFLVEVLAAPS